MGKRRKSTAATESSSFRCVQIEWNEKIGSARRRNFKMKRGGEEEEEETVAYEIKRRIDVWWHRHCMRGKSLRQADASSSARTEHRNHQCWYENEEKKKM